VASSLTLHLSWADNVEKQIGVSARPKDIAYIKGERLVMSMIFLPALWTGCRSGVSRRSRQATPASRTLLSQAAISEEDRGAAAETFGTFAKCQRVRKVVAIRGKADVARTTRFGSD